MRVSTDHHSTLLNSHCSLKHSLNRGSPRSRFTKLRAHLRDPNMGLQPLTTDQLSQYFLRVKLNKNLETLQPDLHLLCQMHLAHVQQIAYENLSLHLDKVSRRCKSCWCAKSRRICPQQYAQLFWHDLTVFNCANRHGSNIQKSLCKQHILFRNKCKVTEEVIVLSKTFFLLLL